MRLRGWAIDPDTTSPIDVHVYSDGAFVRAATANLAAGTEIHGFDPIPRPRIAASTSPYPRSRERTTFCVYGINVGPGEGSLLGCRRSPSAARRPRPRW